MSIKLYTGFVYNKPVKLSEIHAHAMGFREMWRTVVKQTEIARAAQEISLGIDRWCYDVANGKEDEVEVNDGPYLSYMMDRIKEIREDEIFVFTIMFYPYKGKVYGTTHGDRTAHRLWMTFADVDEYRYWNNTDRPEYLTARQWNARWKRWKAILGGDGAGVPSLCGFAADCNGRYGEMHLAGDVLKQIPSVTERISRLSKRLLTEDLSVGCKAPHEFVRVINEVADKLEANDPDYTSRLNVIAHGVRSSILPFIEEKTLVSTYAQLSERISTSGQQPPADA